MTQNEIRAFLATDARVHIQVAGAGDGSPELAWGDTFVSVHDQNGKHQKMPFVTIVTKDYDGFDCDSRLNRGGLYRLNVEVGKGSFKALFGFLPSEFEHNRGTYDFAVTGQLFPHPAYGGYGWVSIINPAEPMRAMVIELLQRARARAIERAVRV